MKKKILLWLLLPLFYVSIDAAQLVIANKTKKEVSLSFTFFHTEGQRSMKIKQFILPPNKKTIFPRQRDISLAKPTKMKIQWINDPLSACSIPFEQHDDHLYTFDIVEDQGNLLVKKVAFSNFDVEK